MQCADWLRRRQASCQYTAVACAHRPCGCTQPQGPAQWQLSRCPHVGSWITCLPCRGVNTKTARRLGECTCLSPAPRWVTKPPPQAAQVGLVALLPACTHLLAAQHGAQHIRLHDLHEVSIRELKQRLVLVGIAGRVVDPAAPSSRTETLVSSHVRSRSITKGSGEQ